MTDQQALSVYLNNHLTGSTGGLELFKRAAGSFSGARGRALADMRDEVAEERETLRSMMTRLEVRENVPMAALGWVGEKAGRLKPNGYLVRRSPLADVIELEALLVGVRGKLAGWQVLLAVADHDPRVDRAEVERLAVQAEDQLDRLARMHREVAREQVAAG